MGPRGSRRRAPPSRTRSRTRTPRVVDGRSRFDASPPPPPPSVSEATRRAAISSSTRPRQVDGLRRLGGEGTDEGGRGPARAKNSCARCAGGWREASGRRRSETSVGAVAEAERSTRDARRSRRVPRRDGRVGRRKREGADAKGAEEGAEEGADVVREGVHGNGAARAESAEPETGAPKIVGADADEDARVGASPRPDSARRRRSAGARGDTQTTPSDTTHASEPPGDAPFPVLAPAPAAPDSAPDPAPRASPDGAAAVAAALRARRSAGPRARARSRSPPPSAAKANAAATTRLRTRTKKNTTRSGPRRRIDRPRGTARNHPNRRPRGTPRSRAPPRFFAP